MHNAYAVDITRTMINESELLLPRGMTFEITEIVENSGRFNVLGEAIPVYKLKVVE